VATEPAIRDARPGDLTRPQTCRTVTAFAPDSDLLTAAREGHDRRFWLTIPVRRLQRSCQTRAVGKASKKAPIAVEDLLEAEADQRLVQVKRSPGTDIDGFVVAATDAWTAIAVCADTIDLDGYAVVRTKGIRRLKRLDRRMAFVESVLRARNEWPPRPAMTLETTMLDHEIIAALAAAFPLTSLYTEGKRLTECYIGQLREGNAETITLLQVDKAGLWDSDPTKYRLADVTRIDVGGRYEDALQIVSGPPPAK
jgi:hypothetical protein